MYSVLRHHSSPTPHTHSFGVNKIDRVAVIHCVVCSKNDRCVNELLGGTSRLSCSITGHGLNKYGKDSDLPGDLKPCGSWSFPCWNTQSVPILLVRWAILWHRRERFWRHSDEILRCCQHSDEILRFTWITPRRESLLYWHIQRRVWSSSHQRTDPSILYDDLTSSGVNMFRSSVTRSEPHLQQVCAVR